MYSLQPECRAMASSKKKMKYYLVANVFPIVRSCFYSLLLSPNFHDLIVEFPFCSCELTASPAKYCAASLKSETNDLILL